MNKKELEQEEITKSISIKERDEQWLNALKQHIEDFDPQTEEPQKIIDLFFVQLESNILLKLKKQNPFGQRVVR